MKGVEKSDKSREGIGLSRAEAELAPWSGEDRSLCSWGGRRDSDCQFLWEVLLSGELKNVDVVKKKVKKLAYTYPECLFVNGII